MLENLILLTPEEQEKRISPFAELLHEKGIVAALISDNANKYYFTGRVFGGWLMIYADGTIKGYVKRPVGLVDPIVEYVRKPEDIDLPADGRIGLEFSTLSTSDFLRIDAMRQNGDIGSNFADITPLIRKVRSMKTPYEITMIARSGRMQEEVYAKIPSLYAPGMNDLDLQIAIENALRQQGCLGIFRINGDSMELFMANILVGDNADNPAPYDFAMGGAGTHPSLPVGADGTLITPGSSVMVDANGNFTGYMTDMTRTFRLGNISDLALKAHQCSIDICHRFAAKARPGMKASEFYEEAVGMAKDAGLEKYFMGHRQHAGFIGHGVGIEINEAPVIAPRSRDILAVGNVIALEPKFVIPGTGAVGIENTYVIEAGKTVCLTNTPEDILPLGDII